MGERLRENNHQLGGDIYWQSDKTRVECDDFMFKNRIATDLVLHVTLAAHETDPLPGSDVTIDETTVEHIHVHKYVMLRSSRRWEELLRAGQPQGQEEITLDHSNIGVDVFTQLLR